MVTGILIILLVLVTVLFFKLSKRYNKNKLRYTLLGVLSFILGGAIYIIIYANMIHTLSHINRYIHEFLCFMLGGIFSGVVYYFLEKNWKKQQSI